MAALPENPEERKTMFSTMNHGETFVRHACRLIAVALTVIIIACTSTQDEAVVTQKGFATARDAVNAFLAALKSDNEKELLTIFGEEARDLISSGDPVSDKEDHERFIAKYEQKNAMIEEGEQMVLIIGEHDWPFPIPLVKKGDQWFFDTQEGKEEILNRRIGKNELDTIQTMLAIVDAQLEYAMEDHDEDGLREYARKFKSDPGKKNGLFWETQEGEKPSPLGLLVAEARKAGYGEEKSTGDPSPYNGYYYRMLTAQGNHAPGGAFNYMVKEKLIGGFAVIAYPAVYGNSGIMTFMVNHEGVVYEKDLGKDTEKIGDESETFDPDPGWKKTQ
jgi:hypothetical protein